MFKGTMTKWPVQKLAQAVLVQVLCETQKIYNLTVLIAGYSQESILRKPLY